MPKWMSLFWNWFKILTLLWPLEKKLLVSCFAWTRVRFWSEGPKGVFKYPSKFLLTLYSDLPWRGYRASRAGSWGGDALQARRMPSARVCKERRSGQLPSWISILQPTHYLPGNIKGTERKTNISHIPLAAVQRKSHVRAPNGCWEYLNWWKCDFQLLWNPLQCLKDKEGWVAGSKQSCIGNNTVRSKSVFCKK